MNKLLKKAIVILLCLSFILTTVSFSSAEKLSYKAIYNLKKPIQNNEITKEITVYRHGPDGSITPQKVIIKIEEGQDIGEVIAEECEKLFTNDIEMQSFLKGNNSSSYFVKRVTSYGRGLHLKIKPRIQLDKRVDLFPLLPPYSKTAYFVPIRYCRYNNDPGAYTRISGLNSRKNITQEYHGPHQIFSVGFIGFTGWIGHISFLGFVMRTGFAGISLYVTGSEF
jgi:hypothetical protein